MKNNILSSIEIQSLLTDKTRHTTKSLVNILRLKRNAIREWFHWIKNQPRPMRIKLSLDQWKHFFIITANVSELETTSQIHCSLQKPDC